LNVDDGEKVIAVVHIAEPTDDATSPVATAEPGAADATDAPTTDSGEGQES
jgi:hypothetical protein